MPLPESVSPLKPESASSKISMVKLYAPTAPPWVGLVEMKLGSLATPEEDRGGDGDVIDPGLEDEELLLEGKGEEVGLVAGVGGEFLDEGGGAGEDVAGDVHELSAGELGDALHLAEAEDLAGAEGDAVDVEVGGGKGRRSWCCDRRDRRATRRWCGQRWDPRARRG